MSWGTTDWRDGVRAVTLAALMVLSVVAGVTTLSGTAVSGTAAAATLTVDAGETPEDGDNTYVSINYAIGNASAGDTIDVQAGTYAENVTVDVTDLTLNGPNAGTPGDASRGSEATIEGQVVISADGVVFDGFDVSPPPATTNGGAEALRISDSPDNVVVRNNVVRDFEAAEAALPDWEGVGGIVAFGGKSGDALKNVVIADNKVHAIEGLDQKGGAAGISIQGNVDSPVVKDNVVSKVGMQKTAWAFGIVVRGTGNHDEVPTNVEITRNQVTEVVSNPDTKTVGVGLGSEADASQISAHHNSITNVELLVENKDTDHTLNVSLNWWGDAGGPDTAANPMTTSAAGIGGDGAVEYTPWLDAAPADGGEPTGPVENVDRDSYYLSIQAAVDAASGGDTIAVKAGTYNENVAIDKQLTLRGPNAGTSPVTDLGSRGAEAVLTGTGNLIALKSGANGTTVEGFKFAPGDGSKTIVTKDDSTADITLRSNIITGGQTGVYTAASKTGVGVNENWVIADNFFKQTGDKSDFESALWLGDHDGIDVTGNKFVDPGYAAAIIDSSEGVLFKNNYVEGSQEQGVQIAHSPSGAAQSDIVANTFVGNVKAQENDKGAVSIYPDAVNVRVGENTFRDNYNGFTVRAGKSGGPPSGINVSKNSFAGSTRAHVRDPTNSLDMDAIAGDNTFDRTVLVKRSGSNVEGVYNSIQAAVNDANAGDTVKVTAGTYDESVTIDTADLTLVGPNAGRAGNATRGSEAIITQGVVINASGVTFDGFEVRNNDVNGITVATAVDDVTITNNRVTDVAGGTAGSKGVGNGINLQFTDSFEETSTGIEITNNLISDVTTPDGVGGDADAIGIQLLPRGNDVESLRIANNVIKDIEPGDNAGGRAEARGISIDTQFKDTPGGTEGDYGQAKNLTVHNNEIRNLNSEFSRAITLFEDKDGNASTNKNIGPVNFTITNNTVEKVTSTDGGLPALSIFVGNYEKLGIDHRVENNTFLAAVENFGDKSNTLDATRNWWNSSNGPTAASNTYNSGSQGSGIRGNVEFTPWLDAPADSGGQAFAPVENVDDGTMYASIQAAVNAAGEGDTIEVKPGTYTEQVNIGKSLTLTSTAGPEKTVIESTKTKATVQTFRASLDNLTVAGFTIKGMDGAAAFWSGAKWKDSQDKNVTLRNNVLKSDTKQTTATYIWGVSGNVVVDGNVFVSKKDDGLNVDGRDSITSAVEVTNNVFKNSGGNGAEFNHIHELTFTGNTIKSYSTNEGETSAGLEIAEDGNVTGTVTVTGNTITDGPLGIAVYPNADGSGRPINVSDNDFGGGPVYVKDVSETMDLSKVFTENTFPRGTIINVPNNSIASATTVRVENPGQNTGFNSIQGAVDNASDGDTLEVKPGTYRESAHERRDGYPSWWEYGLFINGTQNLTIVGVDEAGNRITDPANIMATVKAVPDKDNLPGWGPVSYLVTGSADGLTIQGLKLVDQFRHTGAEPNKNIEIWANNVTIKHSIVDAKHYPKYDTVSGSIYFTPQPNDGPITSPVTALTVKNNRIEGWLSMNNGVGLQKDNDTTDISNRVITENTIHGRVKITGNSSEAAWRNRKSAAVKVVKNTFTAKYPDLGSRVESEGRTHPLPWRQYFFKNTYETGATTALNGSSSRFLPRMGAGKGEDNERVIYDNIQDSVDWADAGDTVVVRAGTYTEQVNIDKGLTLRSTAGPAKTTITKDDDSGIRGVIISPTELTNLTIEGFTIKGTSKTSGIAFRNQGRRENITLRNNIIIGDGSEYNAANLWSLDGTITIANNEFTGGPDGLNVQGQPETNQKTDLVVTGNTFRDLGDNGAEFNAINDLTFKHNTIKKHGQKETAAGLEIAEDARIGPVTGTVTITGNTITDGPLGIAVYPNADGSGRPLDISGNTLTQNDVHIDDKTGTIDTGAVLADNTFGKHVVVDRPGSSLLPTIWGEIQGAVDASQNGDTVLVGPGTYDEAVTIDTANVTVEGPNAGIPGDSDARGEEAIVQRMAFGAGANSSTIDGFTFTGVPGKSRDAVNANVGTGLVDLAVRNNRFVDLPEGATAISTFNLPGTSNTYEITIENNEIAGVAGSASGIFLQNPVDSVITDNRIDAQSADADTRGIQLSGASGVVISDNVISNAGAKGIQVAGSPDPARAIVIRDNRLVNNGNGAASGPDEGGIAIYPDVGNLSVVANTFRGNDIAFAVRDKNREAAYANGGVVLRKNDFGGDNANANGYVVKDFKGAGTLDATLNWWGDPGAAGANVAGGVVYDPFLTAPPGQVARDPAELQQFGHDLTLPRDGDTYAVAFPGDLDTTVREVFSDLEEGEQVWAYNATDDEWLSGPEIADREVGALDAFLVSTKDKDSTDPVRIVFDYADASSPQAPTTKSVSAGWNLVGAAQYGSVDDAFDATVGVDRVAAVYSQAGSQPGGDGAPAPFVADSADSTRVSPFVGYWVFVDGDGEMAANIYPGVTADEERAALAY